MEGESALVSGESAAGKVSPYPVPRVVREANLGPLPPGSQVYHPAAAHRWAPYDSFMSVLRGLMLVNFKESISRTMAGECLSSLTRHRVPFAACRRFPDDEIYVCVDRALAMDRKDGKEYYDAVRDAMNAVLRDDVSSPPVMYNRTIFESAFQLQWVE